MDRQPREYGRFNVPNASGSGDVFEPKSNNDAKQRAALIEWLNSTLPNLNLTVNASDEELRTFLADGTVLCRLLNKLKLGSVIEYGNPHRSPETHSENVRKFLSALDDMRLPRFNISDLEKGSMKIILECLLTLKAHFMPNIGGVSPNSTSPTNMGSDAMRWKQLVEHFGSGDGPHGDLSPRTYAAIVAGDERRKGTSDSKLHRALRSPVMAEPSAALMHHVGQKYHEVFQIKHGGYTDLPAAKISELMKSNSLDNAPTQSLLSMVNGILDESIDRKNGEIPHRVACLLRKVVQEIERRISTQAEHLKTQNNLFKTREEKYQSRIRVLEALATGTGEESKVVPNQFDQIKTESIKVDVEKRYEDLDVELLMKENDKRSHEIEALKQELERARKRHEKDDRSHEIEALKQELEKARKTHEVDNRSHEIEALKQELEKARKTHEVDDRSHEIEALKQELEKARKTHEDRCLQMENTAKEAQLELEEKLKEVEDNLHESRVKLKELEENSEAKSQWWKKKEHLYQIFTEFQLGALRELRFTSQSVRQEVLKTYKCYSQDFDRLGPKIKSLRDAEEGYHGILRENQKLHNEIQELKGNIRVYCRIRPFFPGQSDKQSTIDYIGENGELIVVNPSKQGKEGRKSFKFNKVYGPRSTQADVYIDTQPLIQSVLDGYNVCIFAYGQTGSGKTYTMSGPDKGTEEDWGVNYRALNDLFRISQSRQSTYRYEVGVQMVEIYNEQVRDLLSNDSSQKKLGISSSSQNSGLAVPDASMCPVNAPSDVLGLMEIGFKNRARSSTAMNERSSRSHSVVTIHVSGSDMKTGASLRGSLHLVDLAGSERIDRSEVTGDRLKEAQHINKSLSALGDVIFALAQKSAHVPYRNSKLTQLLQSSLGGQAKTLMFVQLNPEAASYTETLSTLKFAERVSGVELGAARSSKEGGNVKELMEQVASLKDTIAKKDEEIERLQLLKDKNVYPSVNGEKRALRYGSPSPSTNSIKGASQRSSIKVAGAGKGESGHTEKAALIHENHSDGSDRSAEESKHRKEFLRQSSRAEGQNFSDDADILGFGDAEYGERLSDVSDSCLSVGTDTDGSVDSSVHEDAKPSEKPDKPNSTVKVARPTSKLVKDSTKVPTGIKKSVSGGTLGSKTVRKWS